MIELYSADEPKRQPSQQVASEEQLERDSRGICDDIHELVGGAAALDAPNVMLHHRRAFVG
jgi:hypothetical protein